MEKHLRKATESDRHHIALCIAEGFEKDFSVLSPDNKKIAAAIAVSYTHLTLPTIYSV